MKILLLGDTQWSDSELLGVFALYLRVGVARMFSETLEKSA